ncbi:hypothetical protein Hanom_Chr09g00803621 [Helianthus anomalus]
MPPGPNQAVINWREDELNNLVQNFVFSSDWGVQFPTPNCTTLDMTLYADFFLGGNFRLVTAPDPTPGAGAASQSNGIGVY